jgi:hypothetical protein
MSLDKLLLELRKLNRSEKLKAMQILVNELAAEEDLSLLANAEYDLSTSYGNESSTDTLWQFLQTFKEK